MVWADKNFARSIWPDAGQMDDAELDLYLEVVKPAIVAYAPTLAEDAEVPLNWRMAQVIQARTAYAALIAGVSGNPDSGLGVALFPLDWHVKQLLRPAQGAPKVG